MKRTGRLLVVAVAALLLAACDKCGQPLLKMLGAPSADVCSSDQPKG